MKRFIPRIVGALIGLSFFLGIVASAPAWDVAEMNKTVNQTNFILDNICSATLISLKYKLVVTNYHCVDTKVKQDDRDETQADGTVKKVTRWKTEDVSLYQKGYSGFEQV